MRVGRTGCPWARQLQVPRLDVGLGRGGPDRAAQGSRCCGRCGLPLAHPGSGPHQPPTGAPTNAGPAFWGTGEVLGSSGVGCVLLRDHRAPGRAAPGLPGGRLRVGQVSAPLGSQLAAPGGRASPSPASATPCVSQEMEAGEMSLASARGPLHPAVAARLCSRWGESPGRWVWLPGLGGPDPGTGPPVPWQASQRLKQ